MITLLSTYGLAVFTDGTIKRLTRAGTWRTVRPKTRADGYQTFRYRGRDVYVHRFNCEVFHGPPPTPAHEAHHEDRNRGHNASTNLRWLTPAENKALRVFPSRRVRRALTEPSHPALKRLWRLRNAQHP